MKSEPLSLDQRSRIDDVPVGLKNVGNTCYFNSFIQALFFLPNVTLKLLNANITNQYAEQAKLAKQIVPQDSNERQAKEDKLQILARKQQSTVMATHLQQLMANLMFTNQKYVDPTPVLNNVVDDDNNR